MSTRVCTKIFLIKAKKNILYWVYKGVQGVKLFFSHPQKNIAYGYKFSGMGWLKIFE